MLVGVKIAVLLVASYVTCPATGAEAGPVSVKVVALMVDGFIALLNVAVTAALAHVPVAPLAGITEFTVGAVTPGLLPARSGSLHPVAKTSNENAVNQNAVKQTL